MKRSFKIALLSGVWLAHALIAMQPTPEKTVSAISIESTQNQPAPRESESSSEMVTFYWENEQGEREQIGQVPTDIAEKISPVYKKQLEDPFARDRYSVVLSAEQVSKESALLFVELLSQSQLLKSIWGPYVAQYQPQVPRLVQSRLSLWLEAKLRLISQRSPLILELIMLCDQFQITKFNPELSTVLAQIIRDPAWYNAQEFPLPEISGIVKEITHMIVSHYPYNVTMVHDPIIIQHGNTVTPVQFSPDGKYIVTASYDNTAKIY
ncbi:WD40 domain-containing protein, partial [Candidatus Dependentiae bacterium]|nr:WD40 domain-containing protein [Candidatus Dependentiae bacterium]